jgi:hypothetical protein
MESEERMGIAAASVNVGLWHYDAAARQLWATDHCRVMFNILMNAMDAARSPGARDRAITVATASPRPGYVETVVTDHGPGIAADEQARLIEPFFTTKEHRLGLGLAICNSIINAHGGTLRIVKGIDCGARELHAADHPSRDDAVASGKPSSCARNCIEWRWIVNSSVNFSICAGYFGYFTLPKAPPVNVI